MDYTIPMSMIDQTAKIKELTAQLAEAKTTNLAIRLERDQALAQLHSQLADANNKIAGLEEMYSELYQHHAEEKHSGELCEIETLHAQLAELEEQYHSLTLQYNEAVFRESLTKQQLAERDAEIKRLHRIVSSTERWEKLDDLLSNTRKHTAQEIIQYIIDQGKVAFGSLSARDYVYDIIDSDIEELRQRY